MKKKLSWSEVCALAGAVRKTLPIPPMKDVLACEDPVQILKWVRFCAGADTPSECKTVDYIWKKMDQMREEILKGENDASTIRR